MKIKLKDLISVLNSFQPEDTVVFGGSSKATIEISHRGNGATQIQFCCEEEQIKYRTVSTVDQYNSFDYKFLND